jgi:hypothetical protein
MNKEHAFCPSDSHDPQDERISFTPREYDNLSPPMRSILFYIPLVAPACPVCLCVPMLLHPPRLLHKHIIMETTLDARRVFLCFTSSAIVSLCDGGNLILVKKGNKISNAQHHLAPALYMCVCATRPQRTPGKKDTRRVRWLAAHSSVRFTRFGSAHTLSFDLHNLARRRCVIVPGVSVCGCANIIPY